MKDKGLCCREPITWELYRSINGKDINVHEMTGNYIAINDESCDIDTINDIENLKRKLGGIKMIKVEALQDFSLRDFNKVEELERKGKNNDGEDDNTVTVIIIAAAAVAVIAVITVIIVKKSKKPANKTDDKEE